MKNREAAAEIVKEMGLNADHDEFYPKVFSALSKKIKQGTANQHELQCCIEDYDKLSEYLDISAVQDSCAVRNVLRTRRIAHLVINGEGKIEEEQLAGIIEKLQQHLYSLGPGRYKDAKRQEHILRVLKELQKDQSLQNRLLSIAKPVGHRHAERIIRATLGIDEKVSLTDTHTRRAVLSAWLCYLRQSVGSCFGTAPAILVQQEQPHLFLKDMTELLNKGRLTRIIGGEEFSVPLSHSWGSGDLKKPMVLTERMFDENAEINEKLWWSPGLLMGLKKIGYFSDESSIIRRRRKVKKHILKVLKKLPHHRDIYFATCEDLLRLILMDFHKVTEEAVKAYEKRPRNVVTNPFISHQDTETKASSGTPAAFLRDFEIASKEFVCLADNALLKAWEFSIASFAETKSTFTKWNLYSSLGMAPDDVQGIGECLYRRVKTLLDSANREVEKLQSEYEQIYAQVKMLGNRLRRSETEQEARWRKIEYQSKMNEFNSLEEMRNREHHRAKKLAAMFQIMIDRYYELFPQYFQEVYDADMHLAVGQYDDSPAGFHLLYKHGRTNTSQWTSIRNENDYVESLAAFFIATEHEIKNDPQLEGLEKDISDAITAVVSHVRTPNFLETAFYRMAIAHKTAPIKNPLDNLDKIEKKPWEYTSGGNVETLMSGYFAREHKPSVVERWIENEMELLMYVVDTLKQTPPNIINEFEKNPHKSLLMHSPTHVFLLKPNREAFAKSWQNEAYTYIWIRDHYKQPTIKFIHEYKLNDAMMHCLIERLADRLHPDVKPQIKQIFRTFPRNMTPPEFREHILKNVTRTAEMSYDKKSITPQEIDSVLYENLPLIPTAELSNYIQNVLETLPHVDAKKAKEIYENHCYIRGGTPYIGSIQFLNLCKALILLTQQHTSFSDDYHRLIQKSAQKLGYAFPEPVIFADTNWTEGMFGFVVNPGTAEFEFWNFDDIGSTGFEMRTWKQWLDGSQKNNPWGIYNKPFEYYADLGERNKIR